MKKLTTALFTLPFAIILIIFGVINRHRIQIYFNPLSINDQASLTMPAFIVILTALLTGVIIGGVIVWKHQRHYRKLARSQTSKVKQLQNEAERQKQRADILSDEQNNNHNLIPPLN